MRAWFRRTVLPAVQTSPLMNRKHLAHYETKQQSSIKDPGLLNSRSPQWSPQFLNVYRVLVKEVGMLHAGNQDSVPTFLGVSLQSNSKCFTKIVQFLSFKKIFILAKFSTKNLGSLLYLHVTPCPDWFGIGVVKCVFLFWFKK